MAETPRDWFSAPATAGNWMASDGRDHEIVVTSRVRLARNVAGFPFRARLEPKRAKEVEAHLAERLGALSLAADQAYLRLADLDPLDTELLFERHLISKDLARELEGPRAVFFSRSRNVSVMVNEEDHLRLQALGPGGNLEALLEQVRDVDHLVGERVSYAYHPRFGYLTSCPTNVGTGLRLSVMLHLPALVHSKEIDKVFDAASKMKLAVRGFYGEGTSYLGDFFQVSNQVTLGRSVDKLLADIQRVLPKLVDYERDMRRTIAEEAGKGLEDRIWRAFGILSHARRLTSQEALDLLSHVRLGVCVGLLPRPALKTVNELLVLSQPAHVQLLAGRVLTDDERDVARATYIRQRLEAPTS
ncbi:MAG: protein arginine kinase [Planctomycetes bacterium]|nr:protein arginine kinase [Planctomycetota bacterium]